MKENNSIPEPEIFTSEIEDTIDDLFKPSKKIEIDPLTQEIKEVAKEADDSPVEFELAQEGDEIKPEEPTALLLEDQEPQDNQEEEEALLELELEVEEEAEEIAVEMEPTPEDTDQGNRVGEILQELKQQIFTIEWEVTEPQIDQTLALVAGLLGAPEIRNQAPARSLVELMQKVLQHIQYRPEKVSATAPSVLKKAVAFLLDCHSGKSVSDDRAEGIAQELKALFDKAQQKEEATVLENFLLLGEKTGEDQGAEKAETTSEMQGDGAPALGPASTETETTTETTGSHTSKEDLLPGEAKRILQAHLVEIKRCINRIEPLEKLLAKTPGMEKLHSFQHDIRQRLERQLEELSNHFFEAMELELPEPPRTKTDSEEYARDMNLTPCPWAELFTITLDGMEIGFPADEIAYVSSPPWHSKSAIKKAHSLELNKLKSWPWSKLKGMFRGKLADFDESSLSSMSFPIIRHIGGQELPVPSNFTIILLFNGQTGVALLTGEKPIRIKIPKDAKWTKEQADGLEAEITTHGNVIKVASANSLKQE